MLRNVGFGWSACLLATLLVMNTSKVNAMQIETTTLANGMNVVVVPDHRAPVVIHSVWYNVGSVDEKPGKTGLSHMLEHLMFKGTEKFDGKEMDLVVSRNGGVQNAFTSRDMTAYHQTIAADKLPVVMEIEADRMLNLKLSEKDFLPERSVVAEERKLRTMSNPVSRFYERLLKAHYQVHPYGNPVIGWTGDIANYSRQDALDWYQHHYAPNNATLLVVGDTTLNDVMPLVDKFYAPLTARAVPSRTYVVEPARTAPVRLVDVDSAVQVPVYYKMYRVPSAFQAVGGGKADLKTAVALWVAAEVLGGSDTARMYQSLVVKQQIADAASSDYDSVGRAETTFDVSVTPKAGVTLDKIDAAVQAEVAKLLKDGITEHELKRAQTSILADQVYSLDDTDNVHYQLGSWLMAGGKVEDFEKWQDVLRSLTVADVNSAVRAHVQENESTTGILVGKEADLGSLKPEQPAGVLGVVN